MLHPLVAGRDCNHCRKFVYDEETGKPTLRRTTKELIPRPPGSLLPCDKQKCAKGHWSLPRALSAKNVLAYAYHTQCKITGKWPDDPVVLSNAVIIEQTEQDVREFQTWNHQRNVEQALWQIATPS